MSSLKLVPVNQAESTDLSTITCPPGGDIVSAAGVDGAKSFHFGAAVSKVSLPSSLFVRARVTFTVPLDNIVEWDQAGILFLRPHRDLPNPSITQAGDAKTFPSFAKIGFENFQGQTYYAVSASQQGQKPEWSLWPMDEEVQKYQKATVEVVKYGNYLAALTVNGQGESSKKQVYRTVPWCFADVEEYDAPIWIGLFVCHPDLKSESKEELTIQFSNFELETVDGGITKFN